MSEFRPLQSLADLTARDPMFAHDDAGNVIVRQRVCECGRRFTQRLLSARWLAIAEKWSAGAIGAVAKQIPDYYVPVHCPPCERRDLGHAARIADSRRELGPTFGDRDAAD